MKRKRIFFWCIFIAISSYAMLSFSSMVVEIANFGDYGERPVIADVIFVAAHWPSVITRTFPYEVINGDISYDGAGYLHPLTICVNAFGWGIVGFVVGLGVSVVQNKREAQK